jgi:hypothetical protein
VKWACLTQSAIEDIDIAKAWYDARDVGDAFIAQIENTLTLISFKPEPPLQPVPPANPLLPED